ncbi:MAG: K(+)-transporting ATPase subunit C [Acidimicrobiia bacterium]
MRRQLLPAVLALLTFTVLCGVLYPLLVTMVGQVAFDDRAGGSLVRVDGTVVGSRLLGQRFAGDGYFEPRPSAAGPDGYDGAASGGSNLGPTNAALAEQVAERVAAYRARNGVPAGMPVPVDAVTASASGLDPHISVANARLQAPRVAAARDVEVDRVLALIDAHTDAPSLGFLGGRAVDVLELNLALDRLPSAG